MKNLVILLVCINSASSALVSAGEAGIPNDYHLEASNLVPSSPYPFSFQADGDEAVLQVNFLKMGGVEGQTKFKDFLKPFGLEGERVENLNRLDIRIKKDHCVYLTETPAALRCDPDGRGAKIGQLVVSQNGKNAIDLTPFMAFDKDLNVDFSRAEFYTRVLSGFRTSTWSDPVLFYDLDLRIGIKNAVASEYAPSAYAWLSLDNIKVIGVSINGKVQR